MKNPIVTRKENQRQSPVYRPGEIGSSSPGRPVEKRTAFLDVCASLSGFTGDETDDLDTTLVKLGRRNLIDLVDSDRRELSLEEAMVVTVEVDVDAAESPRDVGGVKVKVLADMLVLALDFLSDERRGGEGKGRADRIMRPRSSPNLCRLKWRACGTRPYGDGGALWWGGPRCGVHER